jgi:hypothetical protein
MPGPMILVRALAGAVETEQSCMKSIRRAGWMLTSPSGHRRAHPLIPALLVARSQISRISAQPGIDQPENPFADLLRGPR